METIDLETRYEYIPIRVKDTNWKPMNMFNLINNLSDITVIPEGTQSKKILALKWDANMCNKFISPLMYQWYKGIIDESDLAENMRNLFKDKWNKSYEALMATYNPIHNYDMNENEVSDNTANSNGTSTSHVENSGTSEDITNNKVYAYNSEVGTNESSKDTTNTNSDTSNGNTSDTRNTTENTDRTLTRKGNIGVKTTQSMISEELSLRKFVLLDEVYNDIVGELTISYYGYN